MNYFLGRNLLPKLLAILTALILWIFVMNEQNPPVEGTFQVSLSSRNLSGKMIVMEAPESVRVKVRGLRNAIAGAAGRNFQAYVDLKGLSPGQYDLPVAVALPTGYELVEVVPTKVNVTIEAVQSREFPVEPRLTGPIVGQMTLGKVELSPKTVTITGPQSILDSIGKVLAPVEIRDRTPAFVMEAKLFIAGVDGNELKSLKVEPAQVKVSGALEPGTVSKTVDVKTVLTGNLPEGVLLRRVFTEPAKVELRGPKAILDRLTAVSTEPVALTGITKDITREVPLQLQPGITVARKTVMVRITVGQGP
jgi:YbbR domain-containing protein